MNNHYYISTADNLEKFFESSIDFRSISFKTFDVLDLSAATHYCNPKKILKGKVWKEIIVQQFFSCDGKSMTDVFGEEA